MFTPNPKRYVIADKASDFVAQRREIQNNFVVIVIQVIDVIHYLGYIISSEMFTTDIQEISEKLPEMRLRIVLLFIDEQN